MKPKPLTIYQTQVLQECANYALCNADRRGRWFRLGGYGYPSIRINDATLRMLAKRGLINSADCYRATEAGKKLLAEVLAPHTSSP